MLGKSSKQLPAHRAMTFRSHWLIHHVTLCIRHKRPHETLSKEAAPSLRYDTAAQFANIADRIIADDAPFERRDPTPFEIWFDQRLAGQPHATTWLGDHPLHAAAVFCRLWGIALLKLHDLRLEYLAVITRTEWAFITLGNAISLESLVCCGITYWRSVRSTRPVPVRLQEFIDSAPLHLLRSPDIDEARNECRRSCADVESSLD